MSCYAAKLALTLGAAALLHIPLAAAAPPITALAFTPDSKHVVAASQARITLYDWPALERNREMLAAFSHVCDLSFASDGKSLVIAGGHPGHFGGFQQFDWPSGRPREEHQLLGHVAYQFAWARGDEQLFLAAGNGNLLLTTREGKIKQRFTGHSRDVLCVAVSHDGARLFSGSSDQSVRVWNADTGALVRTLGNHTGEVRDLALRPPREGLPLLASAGSDKTVRLWQPTIGRLVRFARLPSAPLAIDWTPDGEKLLAACEDGHLRVVSADTAKVVQDSSAIDGWAYAVADSPDGRQALVAGEGEQIRAISLD